MAIYLRSWHTDCEVPIPFSFPDQATWDALPWSEHRRLAQQLLIDLVPNEGFRFVRLRMCRCGEQRHTVATFT